MRTQDFSSHAPGRLVDTVYKAKAFVPHPLPPQVDFGNFAIEYGDARAALGELRGACRRLVNPYILIRPLQRLEAQTTSAMEGTFTTADALAKTEAGVEKSPTSDTIEAANFIQALTWATDQLANLPISGRLLKGSHKILMEGVPGHRGKDKQPGEYARDQNMIGGMNIDNARFIPPPPAETLECMSELERYVNAEDKSERVPLLDLAFVHYQFETIHPFADGNGRLGRMLATLMSMTEGLLDLPILYISPELEQRKDEYIDRLYEVSIRGDWAGWVKFFFEVSAISCVRTTKTINRIIALEADYVQRLRGETRSNKAAQLVEKLFHTPFVDAKEVARHVGVTDAAARNILRQLENIGIIVELPDAYPKVWYAPAILRISDPSITTSN